MHKPLNFSKTQLRLHLLPKWLLNRLKDNNIPLSRLRDDTYIPSILSGDDLFFYIALLYESHSQPTTQHVSALADTFYPPLILENYGESNENWCGLRAASFGYELEKARLTKELGCSKRAAWRMLCGHDYDESFTKMKLSVVEDGNNVYIVSEPCKEEVTTDSLWEVLKVLNKHFSNKEIVSTKLYGLCSSL